MWQAKHVQACLQALGHEVTLLGMTTRGDQILDRSLSKVGGKGLFVKELEVAMDKRDKIQLLLCKASAYDKQNMFEMADKNFDKVLKMNPFNGTVLNNYAFSLANRKIKLGMADSMITTALKLEPANPFYLDTKAWILYGKGEFERALRILNKCIQLDPMGEDYYIHAIACYVALENTNMANEMQQKLDKLKNE